MRMVGVSRCMDDLGRIYIPKEIRRALSLHETDPIEMYIGDNGEIILKKSIQKTLLYSVIGYSKNLEKENNIYALCSSQEHAEQRKNEAIKTLGEKDFDWTICKFDAFNNGLSPMDNLFNAINNRKERN